ncbi:MAG TPA: HAMP domain-containing sensor histidine kinase [Gemmataceae bacterium]|nr:HAMP domain-containing sensor histidine kinase [Gemmataceae bacterium]
MRWSIRYQLLVPLLILLAGIAGISTWTAMASAQRARQQIETQVRNVARTLSEANIPVAPNWLTEMRGLTGAEYLLVQSDGRTNQTSGLISEAGELPPQVPIMDDWKTLRLSSRIQVGKTSYLGCGVSLRQPGGGVLYIFYPEASWRDALWEAVRPSLVLGGFMGLASIILAVAMGRTFGLRIQEMERRTRGIAAGDFSPMPLPRRDDEFRDLAGSINEMAQQLARLQETMQKSEQLRLLGQVSGGLAHQLRNGVAGARLALQVHTRELNGQADSEAIQVALRQLQLLEAHLQRFLNLGKVGEPARQPCSVESLLDEAVNLLRPKSRHANIDLLWEKPEPHLSVLGNADQLSQVFLNLIGNALDAAGPGGRVQIQVEEISNEFKEGKVKTCRVEIIDSGPGPHAALADRIFEPFVTGKPDGVGLGLALARQVTEVHGGRIGWIRESDQTRFFVELPLQHSLSGTIMDSTANAGVSDEKGR